MGEKQAPETKYIHFKTSNGWTSPKKNEHYWMSRAIICYMCGLFNGALSVTQTV
jgi:hypothetical protein